MYVIKFAKSEFSVYKTIISGEIPVALLSYSPECFKGILLECYWVTPVWCADCPDANFTVMLSDCFSVIETWYFIISSII